MQKIILLTVAVLSTLAVQAQNLVANPSFEDVNICTEIHAPCNPAAWESVAPESLRTEYMYHSFKTGAGHNLIRISGNTAALRSYAQSQLLCALEKGRRYRVTILASSANGEVPGVQVRFDTTWTYRMHANPLTDLKPDVRMSKANIIRTFPDKFYLLQQEFVARDSLTHIVIGNFDKPSYQHQVAVLLIDSIAIEPLNQRCTVSPEILNGLYERHNRHTVPADFYRRLNGEEKTTSSNLDCFTITVKDERIFSPAGRAAQPAEAASLDSVIRMNDGSVRIRVRITGYSYEDNSANYNMVRSVDKAKRIAEILIYKHGFSFDDIIVDGKGNRLPRFDTSTPEGREQNNFVDLEFCLPRKAKPVAATPPPPPPDTLVIPDVLFKFNSAELNTQLYGALDSLIQRIPRDQPVQLQLVGHTDNAGTDAYNLDLSLRRATAVAEYLRKKGPGQYIRHVSGQGESRPVAPNDTPEGRQKNRRVEIIIYKGSD